MIIFKAKQVWCSNCGKEIYLFPNLIVSKELFVPCKTFYREMDRYGRDHIYMKFPLDAKIFDRRLVKSERHTTHLVKSFGRLIVTAKDLFSEKDLRIYTIPDYDSQLGCEYNIISNRKGAKIIAKDNHEEIEIVF